jgi:hypothetical protein
MAEKGVKVCTQKISRKGKVTEGHAIGDRNPERPSLLQGKKVSN